MGVVIKVTRQGVLIPRDWLAQWGEVQEVEVEQGLDMLVIRPKAPRTHSEVEQEQLLQDLEAAGLLARKPQLTSSLVVSEVERERLARKLSQGEPLSQLILRERDERS